MIELPEALNLSSQLKKAISGKTVKNVCLPTKKHKFCFWNGDPCDYPSLLEGRSVISAEGFGMFCELIFDDGTRLALNDGVNIRYTESEPEGDYQLRIIFTDGTSLVFTVAMYGGIALHGSVYENTYYNKSREAVSPFSEEFRELFSYKLANEKQSLSAKAFLATEQRFPGIGNGVLQDILFCALVNPRKKIGALSDEEKSRLFKSTVGVLDEMVKNGGRDTEKDIFGRNGGYSTVMSKNGYPGVCPLCGSEIRREAYLGGNVYFCPVCQPV